MPYAQRRERLRALMAERSLDALLVSYASNRYYLSGFELHDVQLNESAGCLVVTREGRDWLCTDARYLDAAKRLWDEDRVFIYSGDIAESLAKFLPSCGARVGFEARSVSAAFASALAAKVRLEAADGLVERLRLFKDADEIARLRRSFALNHAMLEWARGEAAEGVSEYEFAWKIEKYFREHGASELAFPSIVAFGPDAALPHAIPGERRLAPETCVLLDVGCRVDGYCSDQTRTFWFGDHEDERFTRARDLVAEAQKAAIDGMRPGMPMKEAYALARRVFEREGQEKFFTHGLGHGVGLDTHELPSLSPRSDMLLAPGMTVTVEPGLYYPEWGGVRLEFTTLVGEDGVEIL